MRAVAASWTIRALLWASLPILCGGSVESIFDVSETRTFGSVGLHRLADEALLLKQGRVGAFGDFDSDMYVVVLPTQL